MFEEKINEKKVLKALTEVRDRCAQIEPLDLNSAKLVVLSDLHRGYGPLDGADDFAPCRANYDAALRYYFQQGYRLILLGDVEELAECKVERVLKEYSDLLKLEQQFARAKRLVRVYGNHDIHWKKPGNIRKNHLADFLADTPVIESLLLTIKLDQFPDTEILLTHGHQGTLWSDKFVSIGNFVVRHIWAEEQRKTWQRLTSPTRNNTICYDHELAMYRWASHRNNESTTQKSILITGHTHHPIFESASYDRRLESYIDELNQRIADPEITNDVREQLRDSLTDVSAKLDKERNKTGGLVSSLAPGFRPCFFNSGCCSFSNSTITGITIADGEIRLIKWSNEQGPPAEQILQRASLATQIIPNL